MPDGDDLLDSSFVRDLVRFLQAFDREIVGLYDALDPADDPVLAEATRGFRSHWAGPLVRLHRHGPLTVRALADHADVTHSAMSQTVTALRRAGLVEDAPASATRDGRTRAVALTARGARLAPYCAAEWRATERTWLELDAELSHPLSAVVAELRAAVARRPLAQRLRAHLEEPGDAPATGR